MEYTVPAHFLPSIPYLPSLNLCLRESVFNGVFFFPILKQTSFCFTSPTLVSIRLLLKSNSLLSVSIASISSLPSSPLIPSN